MTRALLELCRISNLPTVWTNVIAAWVLASLGKGSPLPLLWLLVGASLVYSAGMILNDTFDAIWDREKRPERPIPSGRIGLGTAWGVGIGCLLLGYVLMVFLGGAGWAITAALVAAILLYDAYHKPWSGSVIVMGACRSLLYLAAASAGMAAIPHPHQHVLEIARALILLPAAVVGIYVVALTLIARAEGKGSMGQRQRGFLTALLMLPAGWAVILAILATMRPHAVLESFMGLVIPLVVFIIWTLHALRQMRKGGPAIGQAVGLLLAGIPIVDAINIAPAEPGTALVFCCLPPLLRYWQRWVAAT